MQRDKRFKDDKQKQQLQIEKQEKMRPNNFFLNLKF